MNIGIIGSGWIAEKMALTLQGLAKREDGRDCKAYAVSSRSKEKAEAFAQQWGFEKAYGSYEEMVCDPTVDLVYVATPHSHHYAHTMLALQHGKACLVEKAFTANAREAEALLAEAKQRKLLITEAIWTRYQPMRQLIQQVLDAGTIGPVKMVYASLAYSMGPKERIMRPDLCGGALLDLGVYAINFVRMFCGGDWREVHSHCSKAETGVDLQDAISVVYGDGMIANLQASACCANDKHGVLSGENGYIEVDNINNPQRATVHGRDGELLRVIDCPPQITGYEYQVLACRDALAAGQQEIAAMPHQETLEVMRIMDALRKEWGVVYPMD